MRLRLPLRPCLLVLSTLVLMLTAIPAYADIGVPMLAVVWPASWVLLIPIIAVEAAVGIIITKDRFRTLLKTSAVANIVSTIVGIPVTWGLLVIVEIVTGGSYAWGIDKPLLKLAAVTLQSPWLIPYEDELKWMVPAAAAALCVPFFFMSVVCEYLVARRFYDANSRPLVKRWMWIANAASYVPILISLIVLTITAL